MSLLFCMWADQEEEKDESDHSSSEHGGVAEEEGQDEERHEEKLAIENLEKEKEKMIEMNMDPTNANTDLDESCATSGGKETANPDSGGVEETLLTRKKPMIGPKSVMKRLRELEEQGRLEQEKRGLADKMPPVNPAGIVLFRTVNETEKEEKAQSEEDNSEEDERPKFFSFSDASDQSEENKPDSIKEDSKDSVDHETSKDTFNDTACKDNIDDVASKDSARDETYWANLNIKKQEHLPKSDVKNKPIKKVQPSNLVSETKVNNLGKMRLKRVGTDAEEGQETSKASPQTPECLKGKKLKNRFPLKPSKKKIVVNKSYGKKLTKFIPSKPSEERKKVASIKCNPSNSESSNIEACSVTKGRETLKRKARPITFSQIYDMDPLSPFLYTSERRKEPGISMELDKEDDPGIDAQRNISAKYMPSMDNSAVDSKFVNLKKIKMEPFSEPMTRHLRTAKQEPFFEPAGFTLSLDSVFSLAEDFHSTRLHTSSTVPVIIKQEPFEEWTQNYSEYPDNGQDPLVDPLELRVSPIIPNPSFRWPKVDPLFLTVVEFKLPKEYESRIRALAKPMAEISPIPKGAVEPDTDSHKASFCNNSPVTIERKSQSTAPAESDNVTRQASETKPEGLRRSSRKSKGIYELREILGDSPTELNRSDRRRRRVSTDKPTVTPVLSGPTSALSETLSRIASSGITITQIKEDEKDLQHKQNSIFFAKINTPDKDRKICKSNSSPVATRTSPGVSRLKMTNVPWLPSNWTATMSTENTLDGRQTTKLTFVSPEGTIFPSRQAVLNYLRTKASTPARGNSAATAVKAKHASVQSRVEMIQTEEIEPSSSPSQSFRKDGETRPKRTPRSVRRRTSAKPSPVKLQLAVDSRPVEKYEVLCKSGTFICPLCYTVFRLNQTYGRHIMEKDCKILGNPDSPGLVQEAAQCGTEADDDELEVLQAHVRRPPLHYIFVIKPTVREDSYVESSRVASLTSLARGTLGKGGLQELPISVKEGLEYYHSLAWKENNENAFFSRLGQLTKLSMCRTVKSYERLCKEPLKVALYLERKIRACRDNKGPQAKRTSDWVLKYARFLLLPFHDLFLSLLVTKYKVIEHYENGSVAVLCLNCPDLNCPGCVSVTQQTAASKPTGKKKIYIPIRVKRCKEPLNSTSVPIRPNSSRPPAKRSLDSGASAQRCSRCEACSRSNCGVCVYCLDMPKFGGPGVLKQACAQRRCLGFTTAGDKSRPKMLFANKDLLPGQSAHASRKPEGRSAINPGTVSSQRMNKKADTQAIAKSTPISYPQVSAKSKKKSVAETSKNQIVLNRSSGITSKSRLTEAGPNRRNLPSSLVTVGRGGLPRTTLYPCTVCRVGFSTRIEMIAHRSETHGKVRTAATVTSHVDSLPSCPEPRKSTRPSKPTFKSSSSDAEDAFERELRDAISQSQQESRLSKEEAIPLTVTLD